MYIEVLSFGAVNLAGIYIHTLYILIWYNCACKNFGLSQGHQNIPVFFTRFLQLQYIQKPLNFKQLTNYSYINPMLVRFGSLEQLLNLKSLFFNFNLLCFVHIEQRIL